MKRNTLTREIEQDMLLLKAMRAKAFELRIKRFCLSCKIIAKRAYKNRIAIISVALALSTLLIAIPNAFWMLLNSIVHFENWEMTALSKGASALVVLLSDYVFFMGRVTAMEKKEKKKRQNQVR